MLDRIYDFEEFGPAFVRIRQAKPASCEHSKRVVVYLIDISIYVVITLSITLSIKYLILHCCYSAILR